MSRVWAKDPHSGGVKIPEAVRRRTEQRIKAHADQHYTGKFNRIEVRFRGALCYINAYVQPEEPNPKLLEVTGETREAFLERVSSYPTYLGRIRYFGDENAWSYAFYTYSNERYEPCILNNGTFYGTPEEALDTGAVYLH